MNVNTIAEMILADPSILDSIQLFIDRMNEKTISQTVLEQVVVQQPVNVMRSYAEVHGGGECTEADVLAAQTMLANDPIKTVAAALFGALASSLQGSDPVATIAILRQIKGACDATIVQLGGTP